MTSPDLSIFVLTHRDDLFAAVPRDPALIPVHLERQDLPERLRGPEMSEVSFFLTPTLDECDSEWIGTVTGRWHRKYPHWPPLAELPALARNLREPDQVIAPAAYWWPDSDVRNFSRRIDVRYPGMGTLLDDPLAPAVPPVTPSRDRRMMIFGNTVVAHHSVIRPWVDYLRSAFAYYDGRYGLDAPFDYRCVTCGTIARNSAGRVTHGDGAWYQANRHMAYLYEHLTTQYFRGFDFRFIGRNGTECTPGLTDGYAASTFLRSRTAQSVYHRLHRPCEFTFDEDAISLP